jgi:hypothetical protein
MGCFWCLWCSQGVIAKSECHGCVHMAHGKHGATLALSSGATCAGCVMLQKACFACAWSGVVFTCHGSICCFLGIASWSSMLLEEGRQLLGPLRLYLHTHNQSQHVCGLTNIQIA